MKKLPKDLMEYDTPRLIAATALAIKEIRHRLVTERGAGDLEAMRALSPEVDELLVQILSAAAIWPESQAVKWLKNGHHDWRRLGQMFS